MAVLIEGISVVIKAKTLLEKYPNGWDNFKILERKDTPGVRSSYLLKGS